MFAVLVADLYGHSYTRLHPGGSAGSTNSIKPASEGCYSDDPLGVHKQIKQTSGLMLFPIIISFVRNNHSQSNNKDATLNSLYHLIVQSQPTRHHESPSTRSHRQSRFASRTSTAHPWTHRGRIRTICFQTRNSPPSNCVRTGHNRARRRQELTINQKSHLRPQMRCSRKHSRSSSSSSLGEERLARDLPCSAGCRA
jgi:hypothetical protein